MRARARRVGHPIVLETARAYQRMTMEQRMTLREDIRLALPAEMRAAHFKVRLIATHDERAQDLTCMRRVR